MIQSLNKIRRKLVYHLPEGLFFDKLVGCFYYFLNHGSFPNLINPKTFNEKTLWRRFNEDANKFSKYADKYEVRQYIKLKIGSEYLVPMYGLFENVNQIPFSELPERYIAKTTNGSNTNVICLDKNSFDIEEAKHLLNKYLEINYYKQTREKIYQYIKPRIIIEELLEHNIVDYKFFCFHGVPRYVQIDTDRYIGHLRSYYDINYNEIKGATMTYPNIPAEKIPKPDRWDEMINIARVLSNDFNFVRVDLYYTNKKIYFGELTYYHTAGHEQILPKAFCLELGSHLDINKIKNGLK